MIKQTGTILKFKNNLAIIMTSDCKIVSIKKQPGMYEGLEILFSRNEVVHKKSKIAFSSRIVAGVAAIFIILLVFFNTFNNSGVYAYVAIDSNTSIEFELDKNNKILKVNCYNGDTNALLKELDLKNQSVDFAIREVIKKSNLNEPIVLISACLKEQSNTESIVPVKNKSKEFDKLIDICKSAIESNISDDIQSKVVEAPYDYKKLADINDISIGRSIVYEKAKEQGIDFDIEDIKTKSIGETLKKVKIDDVGVVHNVEKVKSKKPVPEDSPKDKPLPKEKIDPKPAVEPKDKLQDKPNPLPKDKLEEKPLVEPKDKFERKIEPKPKDNTEGKSKIESEDNLEKKPKDNTEGKSKIEPEDRSEKKTTDNTEGKSKIKPEDRSEEKTDVGPDSKGL